MPNTPWIQNPVNPNHVDAEVAKHVDAQPNVANPTHANQSNQSNPFDHQFDDEPVWSDEVAIPQCRHGLGVEGIVAARLKS